MMTHIIHCFNPEVTIHLVPTDDVSTTTDLIDLIETTAHRMVPQHDIMLLGWIVNRNHLVDQCFERIVQTHVVIVPAGNYACDICEFSPTSVSDITVIEAHNYQDMRLSLSNFCNHRDLEYMYGIIPGYHERGTSVAAAVYAGLVSRNPCEKFLRRSRHVLKARHIKWINNSITTGDQNVRKN